MRRSSVLWALVSQLFDTRTLETLKTYQAEARVNAAAISPLLDHVSELQEGLVSRFANNYFYNQVLCCCQLGRVPLAALSANSMGVPFESNLMLPTGYGYMQFRGLSQYKRDLLPRTEYSHMYFWFASPASRSGSFAYMLPVSGKRGESESQLISQII